MCLEENSNQSCSCICTWRNFARELVLVHVGTSLMVVVIQKMATFSTIRYQSEFNHGVVLSNMPLRDNQLFEVQIVKMTDRWAGSIEVGVTTHHPESVEFPPTMTNMTTGTWMISGKGVIRNRNSIRTGLNFDLDTLVVSVLVYKNMYLSRVLENLECPEHPEMS